jgi:hypothetical protein
MLVQDVWVLPKTDNFNFLEPILDRLLLKIKDNRNNSMTTAAAGLTTVIVKQIHTPTDLNYHIIH